MVFGAIESVRPSRLKNLELPPMGQKIWCILSAINQDAVVNKDLAVITAEILYRKLAFHRNIFKGADQQVIG